MRWDYAEVAPLGGGPGDWLSALNWVRLAVEHCAMTPGSGAGKSRDSN